MNSREIRETFLRYFQERGHEILPSSAVIPEADPTLLFANAGMNQFKDIFTGRRKASMPRAATVQKCIRAGGKHSDLDNVGYTTRHLTFFEMLGNFSFGDYFKEGAIEFGWDLLTSVFGLDPDRLWVTVYRDDDEAREIWRRRIGVSEERIVGLGEKDNYWTMGDVGPCGPCSEIHLDRGERYGTESLGESDGERFLEIWNLVFMQYEQREDGEKVSLARPSIDTGMGIERLALVLQGVDTIFETDILRSIITRVEELTGVEHDSGPDSVPHRVIADHIRSLVFALADGGEPSNEGRGYVLRRILRRAARYARKLVGSGEPLLCRLVDTVLETMESAYPEIRARKKYIERAIRSEEERFGRTLDQGLEQFEGVVSRLGAGGQKVIPGKDAFLLYDTFGFPIDLVEQMAAERDLEVDLAGYDSEMAKQKERSRRGQQFSVTATQDGREFLDLDSVPPTHFVGYESAVCEAEVLAAIEAGEDTWHVILSHSPFYAESGGQVGDSGRITISSEGLCLRVEATHKDSDRWIHTVRLAEGDAEALRSGAVVEARIDTDRRAAVEKNHTATHLLHAALRQVLGEHVHQKGSLVDSAHLRFDVTHFSQISPQERQRAEEIVQREISRNAAIETFETDYDDAVNRGAMALFGEKYGDRVRVVRIGEFSMELCGGTHVTRTGDIGGFALLSEGSVSAGVRRVEAVTDESATRLYQEHARLIQELASSLRVPGDQILERVEKLQEEVKRLRSERGRASPAADASTVEHRLLGEGDEAIDLHSGLLESGGRAAALEVYDRLKARSRRAVFVLLAHEGEKLAAVVAVSPELVKGGLSAKKIFDAGKEPIGGRGGGRPEMVQGGGTKPGGADAALRAMVEFVSVHAR